jgi:hypothetical protein
VEYAKSLQVKNYVTKMSCEKFVILHLCHATKMSYRKNAKKNGASFHLHHLVTLWICYLPEALIFNFNASFHALTESAGSC